MRKLFITLAVVLFVGIGQNAMLVLVTKAEPEAIKPEKKVEKWDASLTVSAPFGAKAPSMISGEIQEEGEITEYEEVEEEIENEAEEENVTEEESENEGEVITEKIEIEEEVEPVDEIAKDESNEVSTNEEVVEEEEREVLEENENTTDNELAEDNEKEVLEEENEKFEVKKENQEVIKEDKKVEKNPRIKSRPKGSNRVEWDYGDKAVAIYDLPPSAEYREGGFEIDVVLNSVPNTNKIFLQINSENLNFYYQGPLNEELGEEDGLVCSETECYNDEGVRVFHRPENVVGSYAVYHKTKRNHEIGGINYKAGKVYHIYRPKIIDAEGNWVWGVMNISGGRMTITVEQDFLDNATYPVVVDPVIGYNTAGETETINTPDQIKVGVIDNGVGLQTMPEDGTAKSVWWYTGNSGGEADAIKAAIYGNTAGLPDAFVDESTVNPTYNASTVEWHEFGGFDAPLSNGSAYHPAIWHDHAWNSISIWIDGVGDESDDGWFEDEETYGAWPANLTLGSRVGENYFMSAYIEYTVGGAAPPPPKPAPIPVLMF